VNIGELNARDVRENLVGRHALVLGPDDDILHAHAVTGDASKPSARSQRFYDPFIWDDTHRKNLAGIPESKSCWKSSRKSHLQDYLHRFPI
jgi:hypothetical protein